MTFTTIPGAGATDATSFVGTDGVDILATFNTLTAFVGAQGGDDNITAQNTNGLVDWQLKAGAGGDVVTFNSDMIGGRVNGNAGSDILDLGNVLAGAAVFGGQNNDLIQIKTVAQARLNGNLGNDTINGGSGNDSLIGASIFGGQGDDLINFTFENATDTVIGGNLGDDKINVFFDADDTVNGLTVNGGEGNDIIKSDFRTTGNTIAGTGAGIVFDLGAGNDSVDASGRNDTIDGGAGDDIIAGRRGADTMTGGGGKNTFVIDGGAIGYSAKDETIVGTATVGNTDAILDWKADTVNTSAINNNGDILDVAATTFVGAITGTVKRLYATLEEAIDQNTAANQVTLVGVGSGGSVTAFALINNNTTATVADVGAVQLGTVGEYNSTNFVDALTQYQIA